MPKKPKRLTMDKTMDKVSERMEQQCELFGLVIKDLIELLLLDEKRATEQFELQTEINNRRRELLEKIRQIDSHWLDIATVAKLYRFMGEADGFKFPDAE